MAIFHLASHVPFQLINGVNSTEKTSFSSTGPQLSLTIKVIFTLASSVTILVSVIGNSLVIYIVFKNQTKRTSTNCLIVSLAISDVLITMIQAPLLILYLCIGDEASGSYLGNVSDISRRMLAFGVSILLYSSIFNMVTIAIDRFLAVIRPLTYKVSSKWLVKVGIPLVWLSSCLLSLEGVLTLQDGNAESSSGRSRFALFSSLVFLVISLIALIVLYSVICYRLWRRSIPGEVSSNQQVLATRTARKVTILMIFIVAVFFLSWAPIFMSMLAEVIEINFAYESIMREYPFLTAISFWLVVNNSACNSCLYFLFIESFRQGLKLLCSNCRPPRLRLRRFRWKYETGERIRNRQAVNVLNPEERAVELRTFCNTHITQVTPLQ